MWFFCSFIIFYSFQTFYNKQAGIYYENSEKEINKNTGPLLYLQIGLD